MSEMRPSDPTSYCATCPLVELAKKEGLGRSPGLCPVCKCGKCGARHLPRKDGAPYNHPKDPNEHTVYMCADCYGKRVRREAMNDADDANVTWQPFDVDHPPRERTRMRLARGAGMFVGFEAKFLTLVQGTIRSGGYEPLEGPWVIGWCPDDKQPLVYRPKSWDVAVEKEKPKEPELPENRDA